jgi:hypothetical protein
MMVTKPGKKTLRREPKGVLGSLAFTIHAPISALELRAEVAGDAA